MPRKVRKDVGNLVGAGVGLGVGTAIVARSGVGGTVTPAFATAGRMLGPVTAGVMGYHTIRILKKYPKITKRRKRR